MQVLMQVLAEHAITYKHSFDFKDTKILDFENNLKKRLILEMIHIQNIQKPYFNCF